MDSALQSLVWFVEKGFLGPAVRLIVQGRVVYGTLAPAVAFFEGLHHVAGHLAETEREDAQDHEMVGAIEQVHGDVPKDPRDVTALHLAFVLIEHGEVYARHGKPTDVWRFDLASVSAWAPWDGNEETLLGPRPSTLGSRG